MKISNINKNKKTLTIEIPLTNGTGKTRIKQRSFFNEYGIPVPTRKKPFTQNCYVEWQIGYDAVVEKEEKLALTSIKDCFFTGANEKKKTLYELSEYVYYFHKWNIISKAQLLKIKTYLEKLTENDFIDNPNKFPIERSHPTPKIVNGIDFSYTQVKYPMLIHKFGKYEILTEIKVTEKQYAIGVQPMLYFCFPITELNTTSDLIGRIAEAKECAELVITSENIGIFLEMLKIFGILSSSHNKDIISIINGILTYKH